MTSAVQQPASRVEQLSVAAAAIRKALAGFNGGSGTAAQLDDVTRAFAEVLRMAATRLASPQASDPEVAQALDEYHSALREWLRHLPRVQGWLLAERARLELRQNHAESVRTWLDAQGQTR